MKPSDLFTSNELYEPETMRMLFPGFSDLEIEQLQVLQVLKVNLAFWQDYFVFENIVLALNGIKPELGFLQGCAPEQMWYAIKIVNKTFPEREFDDEIKHYIRFMSNNQGVYIYPPEIFEEKENPYFIAAKNLSDSDILTDNTVEEIQAAKYLAIQLYIKDKETEDFLNTRQEKRGEMAYQPKAAWQPEVEGGGPSPQRELFWNEWSTYFDGSGAVRLGSVISPAELSLRPLINTYTISLWAKQKDLNYGGLISKGSVVGGGVPTPTNYALAFSGLVFSFSAGTSLISTPASTWTYNFSTQQINTWIHFLVTINIVAPELYINGNLTSWTTSATLSTTLNSITNPVYIGAIGNRNNSSGNSFFKGNIDEVAIWSGVLNSANIKAIYGGGGGINLSTDYGDYNQSSNLRGYWRMGDGYDYSHKIMYDNSINSNNGTVSGMTVIFQRDVPR